MGRITIFLAWLFCCTLSIAAGNADDYLKKGKGKTMLEGKKTGNTQVLIRTVDDSDVLWIGGYKIGNRVWLSPGEHKITVMCQISFSGGQKLVPGEITIHVQDKKKYELSADDEQEDDKKCAVNLK